MSPKPAKIPSLFLDAALAEYSAKLPDNFKLLGRNRKYILKEASRSLFPSEFLTWRKRGFKVSIQRWADPVSHTLSERSIPVASKTQA
jgi:asparagine synthetase B (glutamine-hydrolysing)